MAAQRVAARNSIRRLGSTLRGGGPLLAQKSCRKALPGRPIGRLGGAALACEVVAQSSAAHNSFSAPETRLRQVAHRRPLRRRLCVTCADLRLTAPERVVRCTQNLNDSTLPSTCKAFFRHKNTSQIINV